VEVIDFRIMALWSIGFIANRHLIPLHQIILCPLLLRPVRYWNPPLGIGLQCSWTNLDRSI